MIRRVSATTRLHGTVRPPGDKSLAHRALILGALGDRPLIVGGLPPGQDVASTRRCLAALGVGFDDLAADRVRVTPPRAWNRNRALDCGNSGTTARLLTGLLAGLGLEASLDGDASLRRRPMGRLAAPLRQLGARLATADGGLLPLVIDAADGPLDGGQVELPVASAQLKSALLLAGLHARAPVTVREPALSRDHTERLLTGFGAAIVRDGLAVTITPRPGPLRAQDLDLPGDLSTAAFFLVAATVVPGAVVTLKDVGVNPTRTGALDVMRAMNARIATQRLREVAGEPVADLAATSAPLAGVTIAGDLVPRLIDELPILAVLATQAHGATVVHDAAELRHKESDRIATTVRELRKLGASIDEHDDGFTVQGPTPLHGAEVAAEGDHRLAMALAVAGLIARGTTTIHGAECAAVSHPGFWDDLAALTGPGVVSDEVSR